MRRRVTVVGAGNVGATCAHRIAERDYADVVLVDTDPGRAARVGLDLNIAAATSGYSPTVLGTEGYAEMSGSNIVVLTIAADGVERQTADRDLIASVAAEVRDRAPDATIVVVSNPVEPVCHMTYDVALFPRERVVGMAGNLHSAAFRLALAAELQVSVRDVSAVVLGGHGTLVPILSCATVAGVPVRRSISAERLEEIAQRIRDAGEPRTDELAPWYSPSAAVAEVVDAIVLDQDRVLPCAALCKGEYGFEEVFVGLPVRLGAGGIGDIVEMQLDDGERDELARSAEAVGQALDELKSA